MDLLAYTMMQDYEPIAKDNGIEVSRCRGYRLMKNEDIIPKEEINKIMKDIELDAAEDSVRGTPRFALKRDWASYGRWTDLLCKYYLVLDEKKNVTGIRWDRIHGKKRKNLKFLIKKRKKMAEKNIGLWNKYAGQDNVLYIHARLGTLNWSDIKHTDYKTKPWYLDSVDDLWDRSYCDIYARIK